MTNTPSHGRLGLVDVLPRCGYSGFNILPSLRVHLVGLCLVVCEVMKSLVM